jgi:hypothetical protein
VSSCAAVSDIGYNAVNNSDAKIRAVIKIAGIPVVGVKGSAGDGAGCDNIGILKADVIVSDVLQLAKALRDILKDAIQFLKKDTHITGGVDWYFEFV